MKSIVPNQSLTRIDKLLDILNLPKSYRWSIRNFWEYCDQRGISPTPLSFRKAADELLAQVREHRVAPATYNLFISACRQFVLRSMEIRKASAVELFTATKMMKARAIKIRNSQDAAEVLTAEEIETLKRYSTPRGRLIVELLQVTALRISEALSLPAAMVQKASYVECAVLGKGSKVRSVYLPLKLYNAIREEFKGKNLLFETRKGKRIDRNAVLKMLKEAARKSVALGGADPGLIKKSKLHGFRHAWACRAIEKNIDLHTVSQFLGHNSIETTSLYYLKKQPEPRKVMSVYEQVA